VASQDKVLQSDRQTRQGGARDSVDSECSMLTSKRKPVRLAHHGLRGTSWYIPDSGCNMRCRGEYIMHVVSEHFTWHAMQWCGHCVVYDAKPHPQLFSSFAGALEDPFQVTSCFFS